MTPAVNGPLPRSAFFPHVSIHASSLLSHLHSDRTVPSFLRFPPKATVKIGKEVIFSLEDHEKR